MSTVQLLTSQTTIADSSAFRSPLNSSIRCISSSETSQRLARCLLSLLQQLQMPVLPEIQARHQPTARKRNDPTPPRRSNSSSTLCSDACYKRAEKPCHNHSSVKIKGVEQRWACAVSATTPPLLFGRTRETGELALLPLRIVSLRRLVLMGRRTSWRLSTWDMSD